MITFFTWFFSVVQEHHAFTILMGLNLLLYTEFRFRRSVWRFERSANRVSELFGSDGKKLYEAVTAELERSGDSIISKVQEDNEKLYQRVWLLIESNTDSSSLPGAN